MASFFCDTFSSLSTTPSPISSGYSPYQGRNFLSDRRGGPRSGGEVERKILGNVKKLSVTKKEALASFLICFQLFEFIILIISLDLHRLGLVSLDRDIFDFLGMRLLHGYCLSFGVALPSYLVIVLIIHEEVLSIQNI